MGRGHVEASDLGAVVSYHNLGREESGWDLCIIVLCFLPKLCR
jgi:hypothetical protein